MQDTKLLYDNKKSGPVLKVINASEFLRDSFNKIESSDNATNKDVILEDFDNYRITIEKEVPYPLPVLKFGQASFAVSKSFSIISALVKAGKTGLLIALLAAMLHESGRIDDFPAIEAAINSRHKAILLFDTEQSEADIYVNIKGAIKRAGHNSTPGYFGAYSMVSLKVKDYISFTEKICEAYAKKHNGIYCIIIDGIGDYLLSVNDEEKANEIIEFVTHLGIKYDCPVISVIHQNPNSTKERGHLGSAIQRKAYGLVSISREGDISTVDLKHMRRASKSDAPTIQFQYSKEKGYHVQIDAIDKDDLKAQRNREKYEAIARRVFAPPTALNYTDAVSKIMQATSKGERTAKQMIADMSGWQTIKKHEDGFYRINIQ